MNKQLQYYSLIILFILIGFVLYACKNGIKNDKKDLNYFIDINKAGTFIKDIPIINKEGDVEPNYYRRREFEKYLSINRIDNGVDSFEFRLWHLVSDTSQLIRIFNKNDEWNSEIINFQIYRESLEDSFKTEKYIFQSRPKGGWGNFIQQLIDLHLFELPYDNKIQPQSTNGEMVTLEIATKHMYRIISIPDPELNSMRMEVRKLNGILKFLESELLINE